MSPPWMPLYVGDYLRDTRRLSTVEHGAYLLLIMEYWLHGGLPADDAQLARITLMGDKQWAKVRPSLSPFFTEGWAHPRIERELAKSAEKNSRRVEAGKAGGFQKHRRSKPGSNATSNAGSNALASSSQPQSEDTSLRSVSTRGARNPKSVRTRIAEDAQPTDGDRDHARSVGMDDPTCRFEWGRFRDHHLKVASAFASWPAAWRTWCANWLERGGRNARAGPRHEPTLAEMSRMDEPGFSFDDPQRSQSRPVDVAAQGAANGDARRGGFAGRLSVEDRDDRRHHVVDH